MKVVKLYDKLTRIKRIEFQHKKNATTEATISISLIHKLHTLSKLPSIHTRANYLCIRLFFLFAAFFSIARIRIGRTCNIQPSAFPFLNAAAATLIDIIKLDCWVLRYLASFEWLSFHFFFLSSYISYHFAMRFVCLLNWFAMEMRTVCFFLDFERIMIFYCEIHNMKKKKKEYVHLHTWTHLTLYSLYKIPTNYSGYMCLQHCKFPNWWHFFYRKCQYLFVCNFMWNDETNLKLKRICVSHWAHEISETEFVLSNKYMSTMWNFFT